MTRRRRELGCCTAWTKAGSVVAFPLDEFDQLRADWKAGKAFYDGHDFHGDDITIKLGDVSVVRKLTAARMAEARDEDRLDADDDRRDEMLTGVA